MVRLDSSYQRMLGLVVLCLLISLASSRRFSGRRTLNCEKTPFAPRCRGVAAKRTLESPVTEPGKALLMKDAILRRYQDLQRSQGQELLPSASLLEMLSRSISQEQASSGLRSLKENMEPADDTFSPWP